MAFAFLGRALRRAAALPPLTAEEVAAFHRDGFLAIPRFTTPEDVAGIRRIVAGLFARFDRLPPGHAIDLGDEARPDGAPQIPEINWACALAPELRRTVAFARGLALASQLLGLPARPTGYDHAILKPPHNGRATPWHQDQAYTTDRGPLASVHFWIPLQPVDVTMGCMQFIPGSHLGPLLAHRRREGRRTAHVLEALEVDPRAAVACPLPLGGATAHLPRTLHYTGPNETDEPRYAWSLEFAPCAPGWRRLLPGPRRA